jgi:cytosine/adenosine deaminase-related metal-dependent hydrolase
VELSLFEEMQALAEHEPGLAPARILRLGTVCGARALGLERQIGELTPGAYADMIEVPFSEKVSKVEESVLQHNGRVAASMIGGRWAVAPKALKR